MSNALPKQTTTASLTGGHPASAWKPPMMDSPLQHWADWPSIEQLLQVRHSSSRLASISLLVVLTHLGCPQEPQKASCVPAIRIL